MSHSSRMTEPADPNRCHFFPSKTGQGSFVSRTESGSSRGNMSRGSGAWNDDRERLSMIEDRASGSQEAQTWLTMVKKVDIPAAGPRGDPTAVISTPTHDSRQPRCI